MNTSFGDNVAAFRYLSGRGILPSEVVRSLETPKASSLRIHVLISDPRTAAATLGRAVDLAIDLEAETHILLPQVVPYPLDLECPCVPLEFTCKQLETLAGSMGADPYIHVFLCRDVKEFLLHLLPEGAIVVLSAPKRWPMLTEKGRIAQALQRHGCSVIVV